MILLLVSLSLGNIISVGFTASSEPKINCLIIDQDYVNCTWSEYVHSYSFKGGFSYHNFLDCPKYERINGVNVGCMFPYKKGQRFNNFKTSLYCENGTLVTEQNHSLKEYVKLYPPFNLSVVERKDAELWLYWNITKDDHCIESEPRYRMQKKDWKNSTPSSKTTFSLPFPSKTQYEFQVRSRISSTCGQSKFWSEWSESMYWEKAINDTVKNGGSLAPTTVMSVVLYIVGVTFILIILSCLLVHSERLKIILIPVVPNAGRNVSNYLAAFFDNYDGNVDKWLSMPKDLENGFKPNFTELACPVREYIMVSESSSESDSVLSNPTDVSCDYQCMNKYSSASTISESAEDLQIQDPCQEDNPV